MLLQHDGVRARACNNARNTTNRRDVTSVVRDVMTGPMCSVSDNCAGTPNSLDDSLSDQQLLDCGICGQQFATKKHLRVHIHTHLNKSPRIILKRVINPKILKVKDKQNDTYWLDPETKGSLKLTLKKQNIADSLKLKLKKSSQSEDFTVVQNNCNYTSNYQHKDVAGTKENDQRNNKATEDSIDESFENVMVDQEVSVFL